MTPERRYAIRRYRMFLRYYRAVIFSPGLRRRGRPDAEDLEYLAGLWRDLRQAQDEVRHA